MFLPNSDSFVLIRRTIFRPIFPAFLPSTDSFMLMRERVIQPDHATGEENIATIATQPTDRKQIRVSDQSKRNFLKAAGVVGVGVIVSQLAPQKAHALIMGSSPTTGVVGVKDSTNTRINPATEETLDEVLKTTDLNFDGSGYLNVNVQTTSASSSSSFSDSGNVSRLALVDGDRHVQVDVLSSALPTSASTESTLQTLSFGGVKYALRMVTSGSYDYIGEASIGSATSSAVWRVKRLDNTSGVAITWAGSGTFNQIWDNYASLTYS